MPNSSVQKTLQRISQLGQAGKLGEAARQCRQLLKQHPKTAEAWHLFSIICFQQGQLQQALSHIQKAIQLGDAPEYYSQAGVIQCSLGDLETGIVSYQQALALQPNQIHTRFNLGLALQKAARYGEAEQTYLALLAQQPDYAMAYLQLGNLYQQQEQFATAVPYYQQATQLAPQLAAAWCNLGVVFQEIGEIAQAQSAFRQALGLNPDYLEAHNGLGAVYEKQELASEAMRHYQQALALQPQYLPALMNLGNLYLRLEQFEPAAALYQQILQLQPDHMPTLDSYIKLLLTTCQWAELPHLITTLQKLVQANLDQALPISPLNSLYLPFSALEQLAIAQNQAQKIAKRIGDRLDNQQNEATNQRSKIHLGYVSGDFRYHAVGQLILRLFELHNQQEFEVFAYSLGPDDGSFEQQKLMADCSHWRDLRGQMPAQIAQQVRQDEIDILVDLSGYTNYACSELFELRPAPLQINYLGYPATLGNRSLDYIITDAIITPPELASTLAEICIYLPHSYQLNCYPYPADSQQFNLPPTSTENLKQQNNLPVDAFVFCCFNKSQKLEPTIFAIWMRLLQQVSHSVLWLLSDRLETETNLKSEAAQAGIDPERLIFAPRVAKTEHLHRHACADLFLDTRYYNAHVTASDALWSGTPLVTTLGETFASRVAASLLTAAGLPELITSNLTEYEQLALHLATHPDELEGFKQRLLSNRVSSPLFDTTGTVRHLEAGYRQIWQRHQAGLAPEVIRVGSEVMQPVQSQAQPLSLQPLSLQPLSFQPSNLKSEQLSDPEPVEVITCTADTGFLNWLSQANGSLLITTYQAGKLLLVGWKDGQVTLLAREFTKPMGVTVAGERLALTTKHELLFFANARPLSYSYLETQPGRYDALYLPRSTYFTGDLNTHDLAFGQDSLWLVNTRFSCLASLSLDFSFVPRWYPAFISELVPEDRCHLNGLAMVAGKPKYVTALGESNTVSGWRDQKATGGIVIDVETDEIVWRGLSMPHSPRWHQGKLWLLNSGLGELWQIDPATWTHEVVCVLPGFGRGLALVGDYALVGLCQIRESNLFGDLPIQSRFEALTCGVAVVDLRRGQQVGLLEFPSGCRELYDIQFLAGTLRPNLLCPDQEAVREAFIAPEFAYWLRPSAVLPNPPQAGN